MLNGSANTTYTRGSDVQVLDPKVTPIDESLLASKGSADPANAFYGLMIDYYECGGTNYASIAALKAAGIIDGSDNVADGTVINVYYTPDPSMTKVIGYTVAYYLGSARQSGEDETLNYTVQVLAPDTIPVASVPSKTFSGYNYAYTSVTLPAVVANGSLIEVHYSAVPVLTKTLTYTVDYYRDGVLADGESVVVNTTVDINAADTITVTSVPAKSFDGYTLESTDPTLPVTIMTGSVINVYYTSVGAVTIDDNAVPEASGRAWALVNLICMALAFIGALYVIIKKAVKKNDALTDEEQKAQDERNRKRKLIVGIVGAIISVAAIITFILTEDMRTPMTIIDKWTPLMIVFFLGQTINVVLSARKKGEEKSETAQV
jgi:hypothetical protein